VCPARTASCASTRAEQPWRGQGDCPRQAFIAAIYLFTPYKWVAFLLAFGGLLRGFVSPHKCLSYKLFSGLTGKTGLAKLQNAGSKMFADKVVFLAGSVMALSWVFDSAIGLVPAWAILVFALIDLVTGFCAACW